MKKIKNFLKKFYILRLVVRVLRFPMNKYRKKDHVKFSFRGSTKYEKTPYIIRRDGYVGLFSYFITTLGGIAHAVENNMIPVVDMKNYPNSYLFDDEVGKINSWEYFFNQPGGISVDDALKEKKVVMGRRNPTYVFPNPNYYRDWLSDTHKLDYWRHIAEKYIRFTQPVLDKFESDKKELFDNKSKILGVSCRGTDYVSLRGKHHPIQPKPEDVIKKAEDVVRNEAFDYVYLTTEDKNIVEKFQNEFGERLILPKREYVKFDYKGKKQIIVYSTGRNQDKLVQGVEYIVSMLLLNECQGLITSITSGVMAMMCLRKKPFDYFYLFDLGYYD